MLSFKSLSSTTERFVFDFVLTFKLGFSSRASSPSLITNLLLLFAIDAASSNREFSFSSLLSVDDAVLFLSFCLFSLLCLSEMLLLLFVSVPSSSSSSSSSLDPLSLLNSYASFSLSLSLIRVFGFLFDNLYDTV